MKSQIIFFFILILLIFSCGKKTSEEAQASDSLKTSVDSMRAQEQPDESGRTKTVYVNERKDTVFERILKWDSVTPHSYGMSCGFIDQEGNYFSANELNIPDFNYEDNKYFAVNEGEPPPGEGAGYHLKDAVKDKWYWVTLSSRKKDINGTIIDPWVTILDIAEYEENAP